MAGIESNKEKGNCRKEKHGNHLTKANNRPGMSYLRIVVKTTLGGVFFPVYKRGILGRGDVGADLHG